MKANDSFDLSVRSGGSTGIISMDNRRSIQQHTKDIIQMYAGYILESTAMPDNASAEDKQRLALAGAILKAEHNLCVVAKEAYFIEVKDGVFSLDISYTGLTNKKREYEAATGDRLIRGEERFLTPDDIKTLGLHICRKCYGSGKYYKKTCKSCNGAGEFDPDKVLHYEIEYHSHLDSLAANEIGIKPMPTIGSALWQPCDNIPKNRTSQWVVKKNAYKDVVRRLVPVTGPGRGRSPFDMDDVEDKSAEYIADLCSRHDVEYDDLHSLAALVRNSVLHEWSGNWVDEEDVIRALAALDLAWELAREDEIKYHLFGYKLGEYPIAESGALDLDEPANGILVQNVIFDVGGRERAHEIAQAKFGVKCTVHLSRSQLKEIWESVIDGQ